MKVPKSDGMEQAALDAGAKSMTDFPALTVSVEPQPELEGSFFLPPIAFMTPAFLPESAWLQHIPFAFWLAEQHQPRSFLELGTHRGASYFAFCQAVAHLGMPTRCYAVDTWKGDDHSGHYDKSVYRDVEKHNNAHYSGFSTLMRMRFTEALEYFPDGDLDLLHIDGFHSYEAVREDFESWRPKLSDRGLVLLHDTNVRRRQFGVFRFLEELRSEHPVFEFPHGHGLGVVAVGRNSEAGLEALFESTGRESVDSARLREMFARLGKACEDSQAFAAADANLRSHKETLAEWGGQIETLRFRAAKSEAAAAALAGREKELEATLAERERELKSARAALAEQEKSLEQTVETLVALEKLVISRTERGDTQERHSVQMEILRDYLLRARAPAFPALRHRAGLAAARLRLNRSPLFDAGWYLRSYPDVAKRGKDPVLHYLTHGVYKGRDPGPEFSTVGYLLDHEDVRRAGANPLLHYIRTGKREGRKVRKAGDPP